MYRCHICSSLHDAPSALIQHLKFLHGLYPGKNFVVLCAQEGCSLQFKSFAGFQKYLNSCQSTVNMGPSNDVNVQTPHQLDLTEQISQEDASDMDLDGINQRFTSHMSKDQAKEMCASGIAKSQGSGVLKNVVSSVVESMEEYVIEVQQNLKVLSAVPVTNPSRSAVEDVFSKTYNSFSDLNINSKWSKYLSEKWGVLEPVEIHLGVRYDSKRNKVSGRY